MSKIAEALVKAKERTGTTTAPFFNPGSSGLPVNPAAAEAKANALRKARNTQRFWIAMLSTAAVLTSLVIWNRLNSDAPSHSSDAPAAPTPSPAPSIKPEPAPSGPVAVVLPPKADPASANNPAPATPPPSVAPRADLYHAVNALVISAVIPGDRPRLMYQGHIVSVGEIIEGELVFAGVQDGRVVFNDRRGAIYTRRY